MDLTRGLSPALLAAVSGPAWHPVILVDIDWPDGPVRAHSGVGALTWAGNSFAGVGGFGTVQVGGESLSGLPVDFSLSLVCDLPELIDYENAVIRGRPGTIYMGATTAPGGNVLLADPVSMASGTMDTLVTAIESDGIDQLYRLSVGMRTGPGYRANVAMVHSHEDQSRRYPGDTAGLRLRAALARAETTLWPAP